MRPTELCRLIYRQPNPARTLRWLNDHGYRLIRTPFIRIGFTGSLPDQVLPVDIHFDLGVMLSFSQPIQQITANGQRHAKTSFNQKGSQRLGLASEAETIFFSRQ